MNWLHFLFNAEGAIQICVNVVVLYALFPAYKQTKHKGFLLLFYAYLIGTFNTICDHTIGLSNMSGASYVAYHSERRLAYIADCILATAGVLLIIRSYLDLKFNSAATMESPETFEPGSESRPGFFARIFRKMGE
jgi:hypothetical protein